MATEETKQEEQERVVMMKASLTPDEIKTIRCMAIQEDAHTADVLGMLITKQLGAMEAEAKAE